MAIQLLAALTDRTIIATASRSDSLEWVQSLGARYVIDHHKDYESQWHALGAPAVGTVF